MKIVQVQNSIDAMNFQDHCESIAQEAGMVWLCSLYFAGDDDAIERFRALIGEWFCSEDKVNVVEAEPPVNSKGVAIAYFHVETDGGLTPEEFLFGNEFGVVDIFDVISKEVGWVIGTLESLLRFAENIRQADDSEIDFFGDTWESHQEWAVQFAQDVLALDWQIEDGEIVGMSDGTNRYRVNRRYASLEAV